MAIAYDFTTSAGRVRMLLGDTDDSNKIFADDEITAFLALNNSDVYGAAADGCRSLAASNAKSAIAWKILSGEFDVDKKKIPDYYLQLATKYDEKIGSTDTTDAGFVAWPWLVSNVDGRDDSDYDDDTDAEYHRDYYTDGGL